MCVCVCEGSWLLAESGLKETVGGDDLLRAPDLAASEAADHIWDVWMTTSRATNSTHPHFNSEVICTSDNN
jgi:hypothetical protein